MTVPGGLAPSTPRPGHVRLVGLTGGIASGKSTVAASLARRGAAVVDSDAIAREVVAPGSPALAEIAAEFGPGVLDARGQLDRAALGAIVFADPARRARLEAITHPRIAEVSGARILEAVASPAPLVVWDIPLLYERGRKDVVEGVLVVWCDAETQLRRLMARDGLEEAQARARLAAQMPIDEKRRRATWVIDNGGAPEASEAQVESWWRRWVAGAPDR